jgi:hypothetical protein
VKVLFALLVGYLLGRLRKPRAAVRFGLWMIRPRRRNRQAMEAT